VVRLKIDQVSLKIINQGIQTVWYQVQAQIRVLSTKAKQVWRLQEGLEAKNEEGTHLEEATKEDIEPGLLEDTINTMEKEQWR